MRVLGILACLLVAGFCIFGFMASFESGPQAISFRIGYTAVGLAMLAGAALLARRR